MHPPQACVFSIDHIFYKHSLTEIVVTALKKNSTSLSLIPMNETIFSFHIKSKETQEVSSKRKKEKEKEKKPTDEVEVEVEVGHIRRSD